MNRFPLVALALVVFALPTASPARSADGEASFKDDVQPFFAKYCVQCHGDMKPKAGLGLTSYDALMKSKRKAVVAGKPEQSRLILSMTGKGGKPMPPPKAQPKPSPDEIEKVKAWVKAGAKDDSK